MMVHSPSYTISSIFRRMIKYQEYNQMRIGFYQMVWSMLILSTKFYVISYLTNLPTTVGNESVSCNSLASSEQGRCYQLFDAPACILVLHSYFIVITA